MKLCGVGHWLTLYLTLCAVLIAFGRALSVTSAVRGGVANKTGASAGVGRELHHVMYTADVAVFPALLRSMRSLVLHVRSRDRYVLHLVVPSTDLPQAQRFVNCFRQAVGTSSGMPQVELHEERRPPFAVEYRDRPDLQGHGAAFARLAVAEYLPNVSRVVYLDSDTLVVGDLAELFELPLHSALAAVPEGSSFRQLWGKWSDALKPWVRDLDQRIFNDGVMLVDVERWRKQHLTEKLGSWAARVGAASDDQLLLNIEFQKSGAIDELPAKWNYFRVRPTGWPMYGWSGELPPDHVLCQARVLHWTGPKPWNIPSMSSLWMQKYRHLWEGTTGGALECEWGA